MTIFNSYVKLPEGNFWFQFSQIGGTLCAGRRRLRGGSSQQDSNFLGQKTRDDFDAMLNGFRIWLSMISEDLMGLNKWFKNIQDMFWWDVVGFNAHKWTFIAEEKRVAIT